MQCISASIHLREEVTNEQSTPAQLTTGGFWKAPQRREVPAGVMIDDLNAAPRRMRDEHTAGLRIKCAMVEVAVEAIWYCDVASDGQSHECLPRHDRAAGSKSLTGPLAAFQA